MEPIHVGGCGLISLGCVGLASNDVTRWRHKVSSAWTDPFDVLSPCCRRLNIPTAPDMAGMVLRRVPSSFCQNFLEHLLALGGVILSRASRLVL